VVFDDAGAAAPAAAASESISRTRLMPGSRPFESSIFISPPRPIAVPIVLKKSDSITESTTANANAIAVAVPGGPPQGSGGLDRTH